MDAVRRSTEQEVNQMSNLRFQSSVERMGKSGNAREAGRVLERAVEGRISWGRAKHKHTGGIYWFGGVWAGKPARITHLRSREERVGKLPSGGYSQDN